MGTSRFACPIWLDEVDSTNSEIRRRIAGAKSVSGGMVVAARQQSRGRGRMGNAWFSSRGHDLTFSFLREIDVPLALAGTFPMACALAVRDFLAGRGSGIDARCKWPNDIMTERGKISGILTESVRMPGEATALIAGIGLNVRHNPGREAAIGRGAACMEDLAGMAFSPEALLPDLLACLEKRLGAWDGGGFASVRDDFESCLWGRGAAATARTGSGTVRGTIAGLGENGELLLRRPDGGVVAVTSAAGLEPDFPATLKVDGWSEFNPL